MSNVVIGGAFLLDSRVTTVNRGDSGYPWSIWYRILHEIIITLEVTIFLNWASGDLRRICMSRDLLSRLCPGSIDAVRLLLSVVGHAPDLRAIARLRSMDVSATDPGAGQILIEHKEVAMHAAILTGPGRLLQADKQQFWTAAAGESALRVDDVHTDGTSLLRNVS
jgi:hypothetical protein